MLRRYGNDDMGKTLIGIFVRDEVKGFVSIFWGENLEAGLGKQRKEGEETKTKEKEEEKGRGRS